MTATMTAWPVAMTAKAGRAACVRSNSRSGTRVDRIGRAVRPGTPMLATTAKTPASAVSRNGPVSPAQPSPPAFPAGKYVPQRWHRPVSSGRYGREALVKGM
jgi:hypothetical protein